jgi:hypothetical protein
VNSSWLGNAELAPKVARELCAQALAWAKTLFVCVNRFNHLPAKAKGAAEPHPVIQKELFEEILAYTYARLKMQAAAAGMAQAEDWVRVVRQECEALKIRMTWRRKKLRTGLPAPGDGGRHLSLPEAGDSASEDPASPKEITREMFEQFCQVTGLSSNVLVGKGENLAALVFYISVHGVWSHYTTLNREQVHELLRAAQKCHEHLDKAVARWLDPETKPSARGQLQ